MVVVRLKAIDFVVNFVLQERGDESARLNNIACNYVDLSLGKKTNELTIDILDINNYHIIICRHEKKLKLEISFVTCLASCSFFIALHFVLLSLTMPAYMCVNTNLYCFCCFQKLVLKN